MIAPTLLAAVASLTTACSNEPAEAQPAVDPRAAALAEGKALYETYCVGCHGEGALGDGPLAEGLPVRPANILEHLGDHTEEDMILRITEGIPPAMPPLPLTRDETRRVLSFVWSLVPDSARGRLRALQLMAEESH